MMKKYKVSGMSCAACSARVERAVKGIDGVSSCNVNLLLGALTVDGDVSDEAVMEAVKAAGYGIEKEGAASAKSSEASEKNKKESGRMIISLISSSVLLLLLMYISMGHMMWSLPLPPQLEKNPIAIALCQMVLSLSILLIHSRFFINGAKGVINRAPNMDTLVAIGSGASFVFSLSRIFLMSEAMLLGDLTLCHEYLHDLYFESAAMILVLISLGKLLENKAKGKTTASIEALLNLSPKMAVVLRDEKEVEIPAAELRIDDVFIVKRGGIAPCDGVIIEGEGAFDESALTGESVPRDKFFGDKIFGGSALRSGYVKVRATSVGADTAIAKIASMVKEAAGSKAPVAKLADRVAGVFVPAVLLVAFISFGIWIIATHDTGYALARGISVLVISCPCALGLATPVSIMVGSGVGAGFGVLYKNAGALELCGRVRAVAFDKTGTLTEGKPSVSDVFAIGVSEEELLRLAASAEQMSEHPLGIAIVKEYNRRFDNGIIEKVTSFAAKPGGVSAKVGEKTVLGGNLTFINRELGAKISKECIDLIERLSGEGKTPLVFLCDGEAVGVIAIADKIKADSPECIALLNSLGIETVMLTGDNEKCAAAVGKELGIKTVRAEIFPEDKARELKELKKRGPVCMVGDGINDAPALAEADVGMAVGRGVDIAIDSANVVLTAEGIIGVYNAIRLGRRTLRNIKMNLFWAFCYNIVGIPLAAGAFVSLLGWSMNPMFGAAAMSVSSFLVVTNALTLFLFKPKKANNYLQNQIKEKEKMEMVLKIEGMMCPHCSGRVKAALEALAGVAEAEVSHATGEARVTVNGGVLRETLVKTVEDAGYKVVG